MSGSRKDMEFEEMKYKYYLELRDEKRKIQSCGKYLCCPCCGDGRRKVYNLRELIQHASRVGRESKSATLREKAKHLGLVKYLERFGDTKTEFYDSSKRSAKQVEKYKDSKSICSSYHEARGFDSSLKEDKAMSSKKSSIEDIDTLIEEGQSTQRPAETIHSVATDRNAKYTSVEIPMKSSSPCFPPFQCNTSAKVPDERANEEPVVWPWMAVVANLPFEEEGGRFVGASGSELRNELTTQGFNPLKVKPLWNFRGHTGYAIVEFDRTWAGLKDAITLEKAYEGRGHGKRDWQTRRHKGDKLYAWVARTEDYYSSGPVGEFLRKHGDLRTVSGKQAEDMRKDATLLCKLSNVLELKNKTCERMEKKISRAEILLGNVMRQKDEMIDKYNNDMKKMQQVANEELQNIFIQHECTKMRLESRREELDMLKKDLDLREALNEREKRKLNHQKDMNKRAILQQKKAEEDMLKLAEEHKRVKEQLHKRIIELESHLDQKQALELEIERLKGAVEIMGHMNEEGDIEANKKKKLIEDELKEKEEELENLESLNQTLIVQERKINDEVQEARKELINGLKGSRAFITVKRMGELDESPFQAAAKRKFSEAEAPEKAIELCSLWEDYLRDPSWHPYKVIVDGENAKEMIDEEDEKLSGLRKEFDEQVCQAVVTALNEMNEYNPSGRYPLPELWNSKEMRKASLKEGVEHILKLWRQNKRKKAK